MTDKTIADNDGDGSGSELTYMNAAKHNKATQSILNCSTDLRI